MPTSNSRDKYTAYLYLTLTTAIWGSLYVVTRIALQTIPPITLLFLRYALASLALWILCLRARIHFQIAPADRRQFLFIGVLGYFFAVGFQVIGTKYAGASVASLINSLNPVSITLFAVILLKEKLTVHKVAAGLASLLGVYIILGGSGSAGIVWGGAFSIASVLLWSVSSVSVRRLTRTYDPLLVTSVAIGIAAVCSLPVAGYEIFATAHAGLFSLVNVLCVLYLGLICTALPNLLWNKSLSLVEASTCSLFYPIQPLVSVSLGILVLSEQVDLKFGIGALLILGGILYALSMDRRKVAVR